MKKVGAYRIRPQTKWPYAIRTRTKWAYVIRPYRKTDKKIIQNPLRVFFTDCVY